MEIGMIILPFRLLIDSNLQLPSFSLKWHYEVFRWFDQFVGKD